MSVFNEPKRLARLLASIKVNYEERPLKPIEVAQELHDACNDLGGDESLTQKRFNIGKSMWTAFKRLLTISEDIQSEIKWGGSDPKSLHLGFSTAHVIAKFPKDEQNKLVAASWEYDRPLTHDDLEDIYSFKLNNPEKTIEDCISKVFQVNHPKQEVIRLLISGLDPQIFKKLTERSSIQGIPLKILAKDVLSKKLSNDAILSTNPQETFIRITFSDEGRKEFEKLFLENNIPRIDFINHLFHEDGF